MLDFDMRYPPKYGLTRYGHVHRGYLTSIFSILGAINISAREDNNETPCIMIIEHKF
jgi:hypothetical protein